MLQRTEAKPSLGRQHVRHINIRIPCNGDGDHPQLVHSGPTYPSTNHARKSLEYSLHMDEHILLPVKEHRSHAKLTQVIMYLYLVGHPPLLRTIIVAVDRHRMAYVGIISIIMLGIIDHIIK